MKLNLEIDLDWIDEEKGLDESVKEQIITGVVSRVEKLISEKIEAKVNKVIDETIVNLPQHPASKSSENINGWMDRPWLNGKILEKKKEKTILGDQGIQVTQLFHLLPYLYQLRRSNLKYLTSPLN